MTAKSDIAQRLYGRAGRIARAQGDRAVFLAVLAKAPDTEPAGPGRLP